jgi:fatty-acyl-CoA synthase
MTPSYPLLIGQLLKTPLAQAPDQEIIHADVSRYSYKVLRQRIGRLGAALTQIGVGRGSVVAVLDWDSHRYLECFFAVPMLGAVLHTVNVRLSPEQLLYTINHAEDDVILVHEDFLPLIEEIADRIIRPVRLVLLQDRSAPIASPLVFSGEYEALLKLASPDFDFPEFDENTRATLFYTTGTTGDPKGVSFSHRQIVLHTLGCIAAVSPVPGMGGLHRGDVYMPITPLFHVHAWGFPYVATLLGIKQVYPGRYEPARLLALIAEHGVTFSHCVPTILNMLLAAPGLESVDLSRWKVIIGGAALPAGMAKAAMARGIDIHAGYGMSETCPVLTIADMTASIEAENSIAIRCATGKSAPLVEIEIVDPDMKPQPHDGIATGEVIARAPWLTGGYLKNPEGSAALWQGGWLHTGDVGSIDPVGTLRISDRLKDVIKSGGEWISSLQLENIVSLTEGLAEVAAIGIADAKWGERPCLVAVLRPGAETPVVEAAMRKAIETAIADGKLSKWARPDRIAWLDALPKTSVGKLDKKVMREMLKNA